jgi:hypothetical protein
MPYGPVEHTAEPCRDFWAWLHRSISARVRLNAAAATSFASKRTIVKRKSSPPHRTNLTRTMACLAVSLGGNEPVPIQAAAYFAISQDFVEWRNSSRYATSTPKLYANTFQAHPEYAISMDLVLFRGGITMLLLLL